MFINTSLLTQSELTSAIVRNPLVVTPHTTVLEAIAQMSGVRATCLMQHSSNHLFDNLHLEARSSCVLIAENHQLLGIMTERDVVRLSAQQRPLDNLLIRDVMVAPVISLHESAFTNIFFAIDLLRQYNIRHLPILDAQNQIVGLLTHESLRYLSRPVDLLRSRLVAEIMASEVVCAASHTSILEVAQLMAEHRVSSVVIVEERVDHSQKVLRLPLGILTERDIVQFRALDLDFGTYLARSVMSTPLFSVNATDSLWIVQQLMEQRLIRRVVVTGDAGELLGIVTQTSLLQSLNSLELYKLAEVLEQKVSRLEAEKIELLNTRNLELEQQVERRTETLRAKAEQERSIARVMTQIRSSLNLSETLAVAVHELRACLNCDRVLIYQFQPDWSGIVRSESVGEPWRPCLGDRIEDTCFLQQARTLYANGRTVAVSNIHTAGYSPCHIQLLEQYQVKANLVVPILVSGQLWGLLIAHQCSNYRDWMSDDIPLLDRMTVQLAIAIQQSTAYQQLQDELAERKQAEARLRESEQRYATLAAVAPVGIFRTNAEGDCLYVNDQWCAIAGLTPEQAYGKGWSYALHPDDCDAITTEWYQSAEENRPFRLEYRFQRPDDTITWVFGQSVAERDADGNITGYVGTITDINDRKQAEAEKLQTEKLRVELTLLENILNTILAGYWDADLVNGNQYISPGFKHMFGYADHELPNSPNTWKTLVFPEDLPKAIENYQQHIQSHGKIPYYNELRYRHKNGSTVWVICTGRVIEWDNAGHPLRLIGCHIDITERKRAEQIIRQQAEREVLLREITQRIRQSLDLQTIFDTACQEIRQFLQADRVGIFQFYRDSHFDDGEFVAEAVVAGFTSMMAIKLHNYCFGERCTLLYQQGMMQSIDDIAKTELFAGAVESLSQFQIRANLAVPLFSGNVLWGLLCVHQCSAPRTWQSVEVEFVQQIANQLAIAIQQAGLFEQIHRELADRQQAEARLMESNQQLAISNEQLARATRLKDEFLANMSHELRTPLNAILGMTESLQEQVFGSINPKQQKALQTVERSGIHLLELINDILDLAKIEAEQVELDLAPISIGSLCQSSLGFVKQQALKKRIQIQIKIQPYLPDLMIDERRMRQVLINLLNNAVKFTPEGGNITLEVTLEKASDQTPSTTPNLIKFAVCDTGIGIDSDDLKKLFQPFIQIDSALNRQYQGTGLGLSLVKRIVDLHGGWVEVASRVGVGSQFTVVLPCPDLLMQFPKTLSPLAPQIMGTDEEIARALPLILLAEDNEANILTISSYLKAKGYRLLLASNGLEAIQLAESQLPALILMDVQMPGMDGLEAIRQIRSNPQLARLPIIALTALAMSGDREKCLEAGATDYLTKPVKLKQLVATIQQHLGVI